MFLPPSLSVGMIVGTIADSGVHPAGVINSHDLKGEGEMLPLRSVWKEGRLCRQRFHDRTIRHYDLEGAWIVR